MSTTTRTMRLPDDVWRAARHRALDENTTVTAVVTAALKRYTQCVDVSLDRVCAQTHNSATGEDD